MRSDDGKFGKGNDYGRGRPVGSGKLVVKDLTWQSINRIADMIFNMPEREMRAWVKENESELTLAEKIYFNAVTDERTQLRVVELLLDRIIGKYFAIDSEITERNPLIERLYTLGDGGLAREIDQLIKTREIIEAEYKQIEAAKKGE